MSVTKMHQHRNTCRSGIEEEPTHTTGVMFLSCFRRNPKLRWCKDETQTMHNVNQLLERLLAHSLNHSLNHSLTQSLTHSLTHSLTLARSLARSLTPLFTPSLTHSLTWLDLQDLSPQTSGVPSPMASPAASMKLGGPPMRPLGLSRPSAGSLPPSGPPSSPAPILSWQ